MDPHASNSNASENAAAAQKQAEVREDAKNSMISRVRL